jgi:Ca2+-binding RTX toxin-like protein
LLLLLRIFGEANLRDYVLEGAKWGDSGYGTSGGQVTWSFATVAGTLYNFDGAISDPAYQQAVIDAFAAWEAVANIDFVQVSDSASVDIRLGWDSIDGVDGILGETNALFDSFSGLFSHAEIAFDDAETYSTNENYSGSNVNFYTTALHEIGHALGLDHSPDSDDIMYAYAGDMLDLSAGDIAGAQYIYGVAGSGGGGGGASGIPTTGPDVLIGTSGADAIAGLAGSDSISGLGGDDVLTGNAGNDTIDGGEGNDAIWAGADDAGNDYLWGGFGNDTLAGGAGDDTLFGGYGSDLLFGGAGDDYLDVGIPDYFTGDGATAVNVAWAGSGSDFISGDDTADLLGGGSGSDAVLAYGGNDIVYGGAANGSEPNDDTIYGGAGNDTIYGGVGSDYISGDENNDLLFGGAGNDGIDGGAGNDAIWGGAGDDAFSGGTGADTFGFGAASGADEIVDFDFGEGDRLALSGQSYTLTTLGGDLELVLSGGGSVVLDGLDTSDFEASWVI